MALVVLAVHAGGMEVVVTYLDGDPDRPLVTGCVYDAMHPPPFALPASATMSGLRTASTPGGRGHDEIHFEDRGHLPLSGGDVVST